MTPVSSPGQRLTPKSGELIIPESLASREKGVTYWGFGQDTKIRLELPVPTTADRLANRKRPAGAHMAEGHLGWVKWGHERCVLFFEAATAAFHS